MIDSLFSVILILFYHYYAALLLKKIHTVKNITTQILIQYLKDKGISFKDLAHNNHVSPNIERLHREYLQSIHSQIVQLFEKNLGNVGNI